MVMTPSDASARLASLTAFDWLLLAILAGSTALALARGLLRELCSLLGLVAGLVLASWYYAPVALWLERWLPVAAADLSAFLLITLGIGMFFGLLGRFFRRTASTIGLGLLDRLAGGAFGLARGFLLGTVLLMGITAFLPTVPALRASRFAPYFLAGAHALSFFVPSDLRAQIAGGTHALKHRPAHWIKPPS